MADNIKQLLSTSTAAAAATAKYPVFIDTNLDTHFVVSLSPLDSVSDFKRKIQKEHVLLFSDIGEIIVHALKVKRRGIFYVLPDSTEVYRVFPSAKTVWYLSADVSRENRSEFESPTEKLAEHENSLVVKHVELGSVVAERHVDIENGVVEKQSELENSLLVKHVELGNVVAEKHVDLENGMVEKQGSEPAKNRKRKPEQLASAIGEDLRVVDDVSDKKKKISESKDDKAPDNVENGKSASESRGLEIETSASKKTEALKENPENRVTENLRVVDTVSGKKEKILKSKDDKAPNDAENEKNAYESLGLEIETSASKDNPEDPQRDVEVSAHIDVVVTQPATENQGALSENLGSPRREETRPKTTDDSADLGGGNESVVVPIKTSKKRKYTKKAKDSNARAERLVAQSGKVGQKETATENQGALSENLCSPRREETRLKRTDDSADLGGGNESFVVPIESGKERKYTKKAKDSNVHAEPLVAQSEKVGHKETATENQGALSENLGSPRREETRPKTTDDSADLGGGNESFVVPIESGKKRKYTKKAKDSNVHAEPLGAQSEKVGLKETEVPKENPESSVVNEVNIDKNVETNLSHGNEVLKENCESLDVAGETAVNEEVKFGDSTEKKEVEPEKKKPKRKPKTSSKRINLPESQDSVQQQDLSQKDGDEVPKEISAENVKEPVKNKRIKKKQTEAQEDEVVAKKDLSQKDGDKVPKEIPAENVEEPAKKKRVGRKQTGAQEDIAVAKSKPVAQSRAKKPKFPKDQIDSVPVDTEIEARNPTEVSEASNKENGLEKPSPDIVVSSEAPVEKKGAPKSTSPTVAESPKEISGTGNKKEVPKKPLVEKGLPNSTNPIEAENPEEASGTSNKEKVLEKPSPAIVISSEAPAEKKGAPKSTSPTVAESTKKISGTGNKKRVSKQTLVEKKGLPKSTNPTETEIPKEVSGTVNTKRAPKKPLVEKKGLSKRAPKTLKTSKITDKSPDTNSVQISSNTQTSLNSNQKQGTRAIAVPEPELEEKSDESMAPSENNINVQKDADISGFQMLEKPRNATTTKAGFITPFKRDTSDATLKKISGAEKNKLIATPGAIFGDENSNSGDLGMDGSDDSTRTPSSDDSSSDDSDTNSMQRGGSQTQDKSNSANKTSIVKSRSATGINSSIPFEILLRKTSGYKNAKLTASQSQPEDESQTPDFVPDSLVYHY